MADLIVACPREPLVLEHAAVTGVVARALVRVQVRSIP